LNRRRVDLFVPGALLAQLLLALCLRTIAWPEVTTPAYLVARGLVLYRNVKFVHTPGLMETLGACFALFGVSTAVVRIYAVAWPMLAHLAILHETRSNTLAERCWTSGFFLATFYGWQGNSIWPTVMICALSIPIAVALGRGRPIAAGLLIGTAIAIKQTSAYLLLLAAAALLLKRRFREAAVLAIWAALPFAAAWLAFAIAGDGREFAEWTMLVPFRDLYGVINLAPTPAMLAPVAVAFLPIALEASLERPGDHAVSTPWYLLVALGFSLIAYPRFGPIQLLAAVPCLAVGAARLLQRQGHRFHFAALALVATITLTTGAVLLAGEPTDGKVLFWNEEPAFNALVARLRTYPADSALVADLWGNILPRTGLLPPGGLYVHPWLTFLDPVDRVGERIRLASMRAGTLTVRYRLGASPGEIVGPYVIQKR
jgi:hypothetical protein